MSDLKGTLGEIEMELVITRAATGKQETVRLRGPVVGIEKNGRTLLPQTRHLQPHPQPQPDKGNTP